MRPETSVAGSVERESSGLAAEAEPSRPAHDGRRAPERADVSGGARVAPDGSTALAEGSPAADSDGRPTLTRAPTMASDRARGLLRSLLQASRWNALRVATDAVLLYLGVLLAWLGAASAGVEATEASVWLLPPVAMALLAVRGGYRSGLRIEILDRVVRVAASTSFAAMLLLAFESLATEPQESGLIVRAWVFSTIYIVSGRILMGLVRRGAQADRLVGKPTLIVGAGRIGAQVERRLETHPELGLRPVGYLDDDPVPSELLPGRSAPVLGAPADLPRIADETGTEHVILAFLSAPDHVLVPLIRECEERGLELSLVPRLFDSVNTRVKLEHMGGLPLYGLRAVDPRGWEFAAKHVLGKTLTVLLLALLSPLLLAAALAVRATSPGPIFFRQLRIGRDGREFELLKFRSMRIPEDVPEDDAGDADLAPPLPAVGGDVGPGGLEANHLRLTPIGRFIRRTSIDELPQLWNVLQGDMTLVGPRPERPEFVELFGQSIRRYDDRHRVKSGITGWAQVHGLRGQTSLADRVEWDNYYIENWSLWLDVKILVMTLTAPFTHSE
ncbi:MAG: exopolysaccharide biosynthesis polyprenyl glycosylphosphotransferase [Thermoleophilaceae bacterium]